MAVKKEGRGEYKELEEQMSDGRKRTENNILN